MSRTAHSQGNLFAAPSIPAAADFNDVVGLFLEDEDEYEISVTTFESSDVPDQSSTMTSESPKAFSYSRSPTLESAPSPTKTDYSSTTISNTTSNCSQLTLKNDDQIDEFFSDRRGGLQLLHISQEHSWAPLGITNTAFHKLVSSAAMFDAIRSSVLFLGDRTLEVEVAPPRVQSQLLRYGSSLSHPNGCEISYGLRFIEKNNRANYHPWSLRQFVVYNKSDHGADMSRWIFIAMPEIIRDSISHHLDRYGNGTAHNSFEIHCFLLNSVIRTWRPYLIYLTEKVDRHTKNVLLAKPDSKGQFALSNGRESQALKSLDDEILDTMLAIEATQDTAKRLLSLYCVLNKKPTNSSEKNIPDPDPFDMTIHHLNEIQDDTQLLTKQLNTLRSKLDSTSRANANMVNLSMAQQTHEDTQAVKALTVIALLFLPTTVVLNFFSASFIDVSGNDLVLVGEWWLFIVISIPLTIVIVLAWRLWIGFRWVDFVAGWNGVLRKGRVSRGPSRSRVSGSLLPVHREPVGGVEKNASEKD